MTRACAGWQRAWRAALLGAILCVCMGGCNKAAPGPSVTVATSVPATVAASVTPTATATVTPSPTATATVMPTVTPTATDVPTATPTVTPTATSEPVPVDVADWQAALMAAGMTVAIIGELEETAAGLQAGTLSSPAAGGQLLGYQIGLGIVAQSLEDASMMGQPARYRHALQENMTAVYGVIERWQQGEITSATAPAELAMVRAASEATLAGIMDDLRALGVAQADLDAIMEAVLAMQ